MSRLPTVLKVVLPTVAFALLAGWSVHRGNPLGVMQGAAPIDPCVPLMHGFTSVYVVLLGVAAGVAVAVAASIQIASQLRIVGNAGPGLNRLSVTCIVIAAAMVAAMALKFPLEAMLPLQVNAACVTKLAS